MILAWHITGLVCGLYVFALAFQWPAKSRAWWVILCIGGALETCNNSIVGICNATESEAAVCQADASQGAQP